MTKLKVREGVKYLEDVLEVDKGERSGRKLTRKERKELSPIQQEYIEKGGNWIWMDNQP